MSRSLFWLSDEAGGRSGRTCRTTNPERAASMTGERISGIVHMHKCGGRWAGCSAEYGPATTVYNRCNRWSRAASGPESWRR
jgi:transposase